MRMGLGMVVHQMAVLGGYVLCCLGKCLGESGGWCFYPFAEVDPISVLLPVTNYRLSHVALFIFIPLSLYIAAKA